MAGTLYLCATPIGNLEDITAGAQADGKRGCDCGGGYAQYLKLLNHFEIKTPMTSYHEHNKVTKGPVLVERLLAGESIALVTDAGMPGISDPGADLVKLCYAAGVPVTVAPVHRRLWWHWCFPVWIPDALCSRAFCRPIKRSGEPF